MTVSEQIDALLAEAAPLRLLPDDEAEAKGLPKLVDRINALRRRQSIEARVQTENLRVGTLALLEIEADVPAGTYGSKRGPGRPKKAD